jgi:hypothetical protein
MWLPSGLHHQAWFPDAGAGKKFNPPALRNTNTVSMLSVCLARANVGTGDGGLPSSCVYFRPYQKSPFFQPDGTTFISKRRPTVVVRLRAVCRRPRRTVGVGSCPFRSNLVSILAFLLEVVFCLIYQSSGNRIRS